MISASAEWGRGKWSGGGYHVGQEWEGLTKLLLHSLSIDEGGSSRRHDDTPLTVLLNEHMTLDMGHTLQSDTHTDISRYTGSCIPHS